jgi:hypothetical protein
MGARTRCRTTRSAVLGGLVALLGSCGGGSILDAYPPSVVLEVLAAQRVDPPSVLAREGGFLFTSVMGFPCQPYQFRAELARSGAQLTLRVDGRFKDGCPQDVTGSTTFRVDVSRVPAGTYQFRVIQSHREWAVRPDTLEFGPLVVR